MNTEIDASEAPLIVVAPGDDPRYLQVLHDKAGNFLGVLDRPATAEEIASGAA